MSALNESPAPGQRYRALIDALPVGLYLTDPDGSCVLVNERWRELSGLSAAEAAGHGWASAIHPADRERVVARWRSALEMGASSATWSTATCDPTDGWCGWGAARPPCATPAAA